MGVGGITAVRFTKFIPHSLALRVFSDPIDSTQMWKTSVKDADGDILCVSWFTLLAETRKGNKPDFHNAMVGILGHISCIVYLNSSQPTEKSRALYLTFLETLRRSYKPEKVQGEVFILHLFFPASYISQTASSEQ